MTSRPPFGCSIAVVAPKKKGLPLIHMRHKLCWIARVLREIIAMPVNKGGKRMAKILECAQVDPSSGCPHVVRGETEEEILTKAAEHAKEHGIREVTPELMARVKANIRDA